ncbi:bacterio-opsin activator domain-containing protein [Halarchaeum acidiphilum MH1-52-1]|uniref:Bacterio-opsin activator domain-containing protein n=1 Tax=Halarchaeum acidiphilum MH1-52-1 TaxID=1261545 RepID=U2YR40_9EURY|nr:bacterio-opsin activator domain-containing protein [Halarchaeum acidiphilum MH1-52-1]
MGDASGLQLTLTVWHPGCWSIEVTAETAGGLLAHAVYRTSDGNVRSLFTAYGDTAAEVDALVAAIRDSERTRSVLELEERYGSREATPEAGGAARELFVEEEPGHSVNDAFVSRGFLHDQPIRIVDGVEFWPVFYRGSRAELEAALEEIRETRDAEIEVTRISSSGPPRGSTLRRVDRLSEAQRDAYELARSEGYYSWPRAITVRELAAKQGVAKTTFLEHLRKAEAKLLDP